MLLLAAASAILAALASAGELRAMRAHFADPPRDCRPHTRWWWMGNALTREDITRQLREMQSQGIGGVEQISMGAVYERGNVDYLSDEYFALLRHAVSEAARLDMSVSLNFGGPGWVWGGDWVPAEMRNQTLLSSSVVVSGPAPLEAPLPTAATLNPRDLPRSCREIGPDARLVAVVAAKAQGDVLDPESSRNVTGQVKDRILRWDVPQGEWRIMAFWAVHPDESGTVNHLDKQAMAYYVDYLGQKYEQGVGEAFGSTVESFFGDSFEVPVHRNGIYWCDSLPAEFLKKKGYDLVCHLPALWWELGDISPNVRYDVNEVLHEMGMEAFFGSFVSWCEAHGVRSRVQPYGFVTDNLEGAGAVDIPEMEITAGEKDAVPWFDTRIGPREYVASGAHIYGRNVVSTEAYTYLHWEPYRATLEELKIASDVFLRAGANKFYNHGFIASPEQGVAPTRGFYAAIHISPDNVWWPHYHLLSDYIARSCYLLRQGRPYADVAVYSPLANQWTLDALNARRWTRDFDWGELGRLLLANGYDFDLVNDDVLQNDAVMDGQKLRIRDLEYSVLLLPNIKALPLESLQRISDYAQQGGVVVALERVPEASCGLADYAARDRAVVAIASEMFAEPAGRDATGRHEYGRGTTYTIRNVIDRRDVLDRHSSALDPFLRVLRNHIVPDMAIDFVRLDTRENDGLCFAHRRMEGRDIYFVANVQDRPIEYNARFRVSRAAPSEWDPYSGRVSELHEYEEDEEGIRVPLRMAPYESTFVVFEHEQHRPHVQSTSLSWIESAEKREAFGWTDRNGTHFAQFDSGEVSKDDVSNVPPPLRVTGPWQLVLDGDAFERIEWRMNTLGSWTDRPDTKHFSGTGVYTSAFDLPEQYGADGIRLLLDLGDVGNVAEVELNGQDAGVVWMRGQRLDVTHLARVGMNQLVVRVTNTLINRVAGMRTFPPVPEELQARLGAGVPDAASPARHLMGFDPLPRSGLLGPVEIHPYARVVLR